MAWCAICRAQFEGQEGGACPRCGTTSTAGARPAHLAVLDPTDGERAPRRRLVSSAGPSVPVPKQQSDSVPSSWMARLEAAKSTTSSNPPSAPLASPQAAPASPPPLRSEPPPLKKDGAPAKPKGEAPVGKPAHLLIAELEAEAKKKAEVEAERVRALVKGDHQDEIAKVQIAVDTEHVKKKHVPNWVIALVLVGLVLAAVGGAVVLVKKQPEPEPVVDPAVQAAVERKKQAFLLFEAGNVLALEGPDSRDKAIEAYQKALALDATLANAERGLAVAYAAKDDDAQAVEHYKRYLELAPRANDADEVRKIVEEWERRQAKPEAPKEPGKGKRR